MILLPNDKSKAENIQVFFCKIITQGTGTLGDEDIPGQIPDQVIKDRIIGIALEKDNLTVTVFNKFFCTVPCNTVLQHFCDSCRLTVQ